MAKGKKDAMIPVTSASHRHIKTGLKKGTWQRRMTLLFVLGASGLISPAHAIGALQSPVIPNPLVLGFTGHKHASLLQHAKVMSDRDPVGFHEAFGLDSYATVKSLGAALKTPRVIYTDTRCKYHHILPTPPRLPGFGCRQPGASPPHPLSR